MARPRNADTRRVAKCTRLANLLLFLGSRPRGATMDDIRSQVGGYAEAGQSDEAFQRQLRRDRTDLARMGFPIGKTREAPDEPARYLLENPPERRGDAELDVKDSSLLRLCAQSALDDPSFPLRGELARALGKLHIAAGPGSGNGAGDGLPADAPDERIVATIADAIRTGDALAFSYEGASAAPSERRAVPLRIFSYLGALYMHAYDIDKRACRKFRLGRIAGEPAIIEAPAGIVDEARTHAGDRLAVLPFQMGTERLDGSVRLDASLGDRAVRLTEGSGELTPDGDGWLWRVPVADPERLARWTVENGPGIGIVEPLEAQRILLEGLRAAAKAVE